MSPSHAHDGLALDLGLFLAALAALAAENAVYADHRAVGRDVARHHGVGADGRAAADAHRAQNFRPGADEHIVLDHRRARIVRMLGADRDLVHHRDAAADDGIPVDDDAIGMRHQDRRADAALDAAVQGSLYQVTQKRYAVA